jgi:hypothetical protein
MKSVLLITIASSISLAAHAAGVDVSKLPPPAQKTGLTFAKDIRPLFEASCVRCHGAERAKGQLRLDSVEGTLKGSEHGAVVKPGESKASKLVIAVSHLDPEFSMPPVPKEGKRGGGRPGGPPGGGQPPKPQGPPAKPLTPEEVGLVRAWIDQGAK